ncbi:unnamed protein product [Closterium sp. NIES-53]
MATPRVLRFDAEAADPTPVDSDRYAHERADVTAWNSRDTAACIALSSLLPESEETHFTQVRTASEFLTAIKARYATPTTLSLGSLFLPFLIPDLASFERTADLITHLRSLDSSYCSACTDTQLALLPPPMTITIYFIATSLPDRLASVHDALLLKHPIELTIEVLESALKDVESNLRLVASASSVVPPPLFHRCTVPQLPTFTASLGTAATDVTAAALTTSLRSRGRSGRKGGQGAGGGGGGRGVDVASGGGWSARAGGAPRAAAGDSPTAAGGGDARARQPPTGQPAAGGARPGQPYGRNHPSGRCFAQLTDTVRLAYGVDSPAPDWLPLVQTCGLALWGMSASQLVDLLGTRHAMYAVVDSSASYSLNSSVASLGASLAEVLVVRVGTCVDTSPGAAPEDASLSFTLDSGASHCFFRDHTTLTPLPTPFSVALADPTSGPVTARYTTTLPCPAVPSGSLTGFHVPLFLRNLVGVRPLVSQHVGVWIEPSGETTVLAAAAVAATAAAATAPDPCHCPPSVAASCSCRTLAHPTVLWHHRMGHPSISRLRAMSSQCLILGLPCVLPSLPPSLAPPCGPCVEGRLRATPHSSSLRPATEPFETLHLDVWGPALRPGPDSESFFLVVVDDYSHYTTVFPLAKNSDVTSTLIRWLLTTADTRRHRVSCLLSGRGGLVMEITRTSMTQARAPHFLWPYTVWYATHQLNLWPRVSRPEVSPTSLWAGSPGVALRFRVWGCLALVRDTSADKISPRDVPCVFLGFLEESFDYTFYHPPLYWFFDSHDVYFNESIPYYVRYPCRGLPVPPLPLFLTSAPPPAPPPPSSQSSSQPTADPIGAGFRGEDPGGASSRGAGVGAESVPVRSPGFGGAGVGAEPVTAGDSSLRGAGVSGAVPGGATTEGAPSAGPGEPGPDPVTSGGAGSGGGATGAARVGARGERVGAAAAAAAATVAVGAGAAAAAAAAAGGAVVAAAVAAATSSSCLWSSDPRFPLSFSSLPPLSSHLCPPRSFPSVLPSPPESALNASLSTTVTDYYRTYRPVLSHVLASLATDPRASLSSVSALTATVTEFASTHCLDYATSLVAAPPTSPLTVVGESALGCDALEVRQFELEQCQGLGPLSGELPWTQRWPPTDPLAPTVKRPPGSPPVFKACYVAKGFNQRVGVNFFQTFAPTPKMTILWVLLHVAAQRDYKLQSLDFSTAFLQGSLHEEVWLRLDKGTLCSTLYALGFQPSSVDPSLFVRCGSTPFFVLVYVDDLVFATGDRVALADEKLEVQKRHTCTDLGELRHYLGLQITRDRAARTTTLSQSHMVQQVLQRFEHQHSTVQRTPLAVDHRLTGPFPDEPFEPSVPYAELVDCLMYLMTCTLPDLAFLLSILARFVAPGRHRPVHWTAAVRVGKYLATTSGVGLVLGGRQDVVLTGHCDSSYADDVETHRSTQGYFFSLGSGAVSWRSTRSSSVSTSTAEAEIYAGAMVAQELRWYFLLQELQRRGQARFDFVEFKANTADIFTKALPPCDHQRCCVQLVCGDVVTTLSFVSL